MNRIFQWLTASALLLVVVASSCKKTFDQPPGPADPQLVANRTIAQFKALHTVFGQYDVITDDIIISGVVVADDKSGNLYKQIYIQDSTGGIQLMLDVASLYGTYPVGRRVFVKCKGLCLSDYNRTMQLGVKAIINGSPSQEAIPSNLISQYLVGGSINNPVEPIPVTLAQLGGNSVDMQNRFIGALIKLEDFQFNDTMATYADTSVYKNTTNDTVQNCAGTRLIVRTSGYAKFAGIRVPSGKGSITAIYTVFQSRPTAAASKQLLVRDTSDVKMYDGRCGAPPPGSTVYIDENFESQTANTTAPYVSVNILNWTNAAEVGTRKWDARTFSSNKYAYLSAFGNAGPLTTWLVTKAINRTTATTTLTFDTKQDFYMSSTTGGGVPVPSALKVLTSTNYTGTGNPWAAGVVWTDITSQATLSPGSTTSNFPANYTASGNVSLNGTGTIYVAFRYEGDDPAGTNNDKTSAWEIDNIRVLGN